MKLIEHDAVRLFPQLCQSELCGDGIRAPHDNGTVGLAIPRQVRVVARSLPRRCGLANLPWSSDKGHLPVFREVATDKLIVNPIHVLIVAAPSRTNKTKLRCVVKRSGPIYDDPSNGPAQTQD